MQLLKRNTEAPEQSQTISLNSRGVRGGGLWGHSPRVTKGAPKRRERERKERKEKREKETKKKKERRRTKIKR